MTSKDYYEKFLERMKGAKAVRAKVENYRETIRESKAAEEGFIVEKTKRNQPVIDAIDRQQNKMIEALDKRQDAMSKALEMRTPETKDTKPDMSTKKKSDKLTIREILKREGFGKDFLVDKDSRSKSTRSSFLTASINKLPGKSGVRIGDIRKEPEKYMNMLQSEHDQAMFSAVYNIDNENEIQILIKVLENTTEDMYTVAAARKDEDEDAAFHSTIQDEDSDDKIKGEGIRSKRRTAYKLGKGGKYGDVFINPMKLKKGVLEVCNAKGEQIYQDKCDKSLHELLTKRFNPKNKYSSRTCTQFNNLNMLSQIKKSPRSMKSKLGGSVYYTSPKDMVNRLQIISG